MLKKIIAVLLILCLSLPVCALAQQDPKPIATYAPQDIPKTPEGVHHYLLLCADTQAEISGGSREQHCHKHAPCHRPTVHFGVCPLRTHHRFIFLSLLKFPKCVVGQNNLFFFH